MKTTTHEKYKQKILQTIKDKKFMSLVSIVELFWGYKDAPYKNLLLASNRVIGIVSRLIVEGYLLEIGDSPKEYYLNPNFRYDK